MFLHRPHYSVDIGNGEEKCATGAKAKFNAFVWGLVRVDDDASM